MYAQISPTLHVQARRPAATVGPLALALRWALPWLLTLVVASALSGMVTFAMSSDRSLATSSANLAVQAKYQVFGSADSVIGDPYFTP